jgi:antitoxin ParD1/3/4
MARAKTFSLGDAYDGILSDLVRSGRFGTETEAVRAGIRMLADYEAKISALRREISAADAEIAAGFGKDYGSSADLLADVMAEGDNH